MRKGTRKKKRNGLPVWALLKAVLLSGAAATAAMLLFALLLYLEWLPDEAIPIGNAIVKVLSAAFAGWLIGRTESDRAWLFGGIAGVLFTGFSTLLFSLFLGSVRATWTLASDALLSFALGSAAAALTAWRRTRPAPKT